MVLGLAMAVAVAVEGDGDYGWYDNFWMLGQAHMNGQIGQKHWKKVCVTPRR